MSVTKRRVEAFKNNTGPYAAGAERSPTFLRTLLEVDRLLLELERFERDGGNNARAERVFRMRRTVAKLK